MPLPPESARSLDGATVARLHARAGGGRWSLPQDAFGEALERSVRHRFGLAAPSPTQLAEHLESLHLTDLALAVACAAGIESAWDDFVSHFRPVLYRAARTIAPDDAARDLADSLYAELFGLTERDGARRSRLAYYHGRSSLATWLRSVLAQRRIDHVRATRRFEPLPDEESATRDQRSAAPEDPKRARYLEMLQDSLAAALAGLEPRDQLRLSCYYLRQMTLAEIGRLFGEHEATVSRKLARTRRDLRHAVEQDLSDRRGLDPAEIEACFEYALEGWSFDVERALPPREP
jgi:RNA polymerase sigma-70 factor, ECF subfamily